MKYKPQWYDNNKRVIFVKVANHWTWDDAYAIIDAVRLMMFESQHREIGLLIDMTDVSTHPPDVERHLSQLLNALPLKVQYVCTASSDRWVHMVYDVIVDVYDNLKGDYQVVEQITDAEAFLSGKLGKRIKRATSGVG